LAHSRPSTSLITLKSKEQRGYLVFENYARECPSEPRVLSGQAEFSPAGFPDQAAGIHGA